MHHIFAPQAQLNTHRPLTSFCSTNTGFNSMPTPLPNLGVTNVCRESLPVDLVANADAVPGVSRGLLKVQRGRPRVGSQAELILVMADGGDKGEVSVDAYWLAERVHRTHS